MKRNPKGTALNSGDLEKIWVFLNEAEVKGRKLNDLKRSAILSCQELKRLFGGSPLHHCPGSNPFEMPYEEMLRHCPGSNPWERPY